MPGLLLGHSDLPHRENVKKACHCLDKTSHETIFAPRSRGQDVTRNRVYFEEKIRFAASAANVKRKRAFFRTRRFHEIITLASE